MLLYLIILVNILYMEAIQILKLYVEWMNLEILQIIGNLIWVLLQGVLGLYYLNHLQLGLILRFSIKNFQGCFVIRIISEIRTRKGHDKQWDKKTDSKNFVQIKIKLPSFAIPFYF